MEKSDSLKCLKGVHFYWMGSQDRPSRLFKKVQMHGGEEARSETY